MIINYLGKQFFKIQKGDLIIAINPISKNSKSEIKGSRFSSAITLSTINLPDYNGFDMASVNKVIPFEISGPGDYEIKNVFIKGIMTNTIIDNKKYINTIYSFSIENISLCFLGVLSKDKTNAQILEGLDSPDILFISLGDDQLMTPAEAYKLAIKLTPKIIIPMDYNKKSLESFLKEGGQEEISSIDKLTIREKDLIGQEGEIIVLSK